MPRWIDLVIVACALLLWPSSSWADVAPGCRCAVGAPLPAAGAPLFIAAGAAILAGARLVHRRRRRG